MRILIWHYLPAEPNSAYWFWLKGGMEAVGNQVVAIDCHALMAMFGRQGMQHLLIRYAEAYQVQAVIVTQRNQVEPHLLTRMRRMGIAVIMYRFDDGLIAAPGIAPYPAGDWLRTRLYRDACDLSVTVCRGMVAQAVARGETPPEYLPLPYGWQAVSAAVQPLRPV
ncbi:MAG: hypothetical protein H7338_00150, partial [Candidatus Sericytochromatia bacterium]|nr:hypothetical protein [Candidatus Sericytochromatia bacterium]